MMQIYKKIDTVRKHHDSAKRLASEGRYEESDDHYIEAYANAIDLIEVYEEGYFSDKEISFLHTIIANFEEEE